MSTPAAAEPKFTAYAPLYDEHTYVIDDVVGELPAELRGTLYRNGPGKLEAGGTPLGHVFDGDGMLSMFSMSDGAVQFRNRFIQTKHYQKSMISDSAPYRALGTMRPGGILANAFQFPANVANTGVTMHAGKLLALWEGGRPTELDPDTLRTRGEYDFDGELKWLGAFSAHPKWDWDTGEMFNFGLAMAPVPKLICYRVDRAGKMTRLGSVRLPGPMFNHDIGLTKRYLVFVIPPLVFPLKKFFGAALGLCNYIDAIEHHPQLGTTIALVPRDGGKTRIIHTDPLLHLHLCNTYEDGDDVVVDLLNYHVGWEQLNDQLSSVETLLETSTTPYGGVPTQLRIAPSGTVAIEEFSGLQGEFPGINVGRMATPNRYFYMSAGLDENLYPNAIGKIDKQTGEEALYRFPDGFLPHESVFAPRPGATDEDDGWLLTPVTDGFNNVANLSVFDAKDLGAGPVYVGTLRHHLPLTFHGHYTPRVAHPR
ncbi:carotenoid oxygenase family protein [Mycolicibacterium vaccae]|uniref:carotenoid oxygenase family protein n=1 Tax=Mycolicibacterium vaccae TaxID=1810 RepID=UPI003CFF3792